jgi:hypothetical protein
MPRPKLTIKSKRNNFTLSIAAQAIVDQKKNKSKFVSDAIVNFEVREKDLVNCK